MGSFLVIVVLVIYAAIAIEQGIKGNISNSIIFAGYAFSNIGLYLSTK